MSAPRTRSILSPATWVGPLLQWAATSQQRSRHNALVASTALTARRREHEHVEAYLASRARQRLAEDLRRSG